MTATLKQQSALPEEMLCDYFSGALDPAEELLVGTKLSMCSAAREEAGAVNAVGGGLLEDCVQAAVSQCGSDFFDSVIANGKCNYATQQTPKKTMGDVPYPLNQLIGESLEGVKWKRVAPGVREVKLPVSGSACTAKLMKLNADVKVPEHSHEGDELTLMLQGSFVDDGQTYHKGEVVIHSGDEHHVHAPYTETGCICLAVTKGKLRFTGLFGKVANLFIR